MSSTVISLKPSELLKEHGIKDISLDPVTEKFNISYLDKTIEFDLGKTVQDTVITNLETASKDIITDTRLVETLKVFLTGNWEFITTALKGHVFSVSEVIMMHSGTRYVSGILTGETRLYKMIKAVNIKCMNERDHCTFTGRREYTIPSSKIPQDNKPKSNSNGSNFPVCSVCNKAQTLVYEYEYTNAVTVKMMDESTFSDINELSIILFDKDTIDIRIGEVATVKGDIHIIETPGINSGQPMSFLFADSIEYESTKEEFNITEKDIENFKKFASLADLEKRLVSMFAPNIVGHYDKKLAILRSAVNAQSTKNKININNDPRINTLLVGEPGQAKSMMGKEVADLIPNARYSDAPNATGISLTATVDKENDTKILRHGVIPMAKHSVCVIDEIGKMFSEDLGHLLSVMQYQKFTVDKYMIHRDIYSPTTIIATCNPSGTYWQDPNYIRIDEIPVSPVMLDRFDQKLIFKEMEQDELLVYAKNKIKNNKRRQHNYHFLKRYLTYGSTIDVTFTPEAEHMIITYWLGLNPRNIFASHTRALDSIQKLAVAETRLLLKNVVDAEIAKQTIEHYSKMIKEFGRVVNDVEDPRKTIFDGVNEIMKINKELYKNGYEFRDAVEQIRATDDGIRDYLGEGKLGNNNKKYRNLRERFLEVKDPHISVISCKPLTIKWSDEIETDTNNASTNDPNDLNALKNKKTDSKNNEDGTGQRSEGSVESFRNLEKPEKCVNCGHMVPSYDKNIHLACCKGPGPA